MNIPCIITLKNGKYCLEGIIDESFEYGLIIESEKDQVDLDLEKITFMTSIGIRKWLDMVEEVTPKRIVLHNCSVSFIRQISLIVELNQNVQIDSFYLPYICSKCDKESDQKVSWSILENENFIECLDELFKCKKCDKDLTFYDDPFFYFSFAHPLG